VKKCKTNELIEVLPYTIALNKYTTLLKHHSGEHLDVAT